jgi:hypothetical protein
MVWLACDEEYETYGKHFFESVKIVRDRFHFSFQILTPIEPKPEHASLHKTKFETRTLQKQRSHHRPILEPRFPNKEELHRGGSGTRKSHTLNSQVDPATTTIWK